MTAPRPHTLLAAMVAASFYSACEAALARDPEALLIFAGLGAGLLILEWARPS